MTSRIFISYRTSDGADKATRLARDLGEVFGDAQVFIDKEDLGGGAPWREAIGAALHAKPVLLVLITPDAIGGRDAQGRLRIAQPDDPVRTEISTAITAGAHLIPLLADGVERLPDAAQLPPPLDQLAERTWRRLRAYDWRSDFERLVQDLRALGVEVRPDWVAPGTQAGSSLPRRKAWLAAGLLALAALGIGGWWWQRATANDLTGAWIASVEPPQNEAGSTLPRVALHLTEHGDSVKLYSEPIDITTDPAWKGFAANWRQRFDQELTRVVWRGDGTLRRESGALRRIDIALRVEAESGGSPIETGNLSAEADERGRAMKGTLWLNSEQAERAVQLKRGR